ncbi:MAG: OmpA family protein [Betaproteobacteria bacterium]|nr:OmpA family protein [Betaproteobacteria bacterium]
MKKQNTLAAAVVASTLLAGCAVNQPINQPADRITDPAIQGDLGAIGKLHQRLKALNDKGLAAGDYHYCKALAWADLAREEYHMNYRNGAVSRDAAARAAAIVSALEAGQKPADDTPLIAGAERIRPDLWDKAKALRADAGKSCVACKVAQLEVQLVWAGFRHADSGWRNANPYVRIAEDLAAQAQSASCPVAAALPAPAVLPAEAKLTLAPGALFRFDRSGAADMLAEGKAKLDEFAVRVKGWKRIDSVVITGHADRLGSQRYNQPLSLKRANTIRDYLRGQGIAENLLQVEGVGEAEPVKACDDRSPRGKLVDCLQPNRRVEIHARGMKEAATAAK